MVTEPPQIISARLRVSRIIHAAMVTSLVMYAVVVHLLREMVGWRPLMDSGLVALLRWLMFGLGVVLLYVVEGLMPRLTAVRGKIEVLRPLWMSVEDLREVARRTGVEAALAQLQARLVVLMAVAEVPAVLGFVLSLLSGILTDFYILGGMSLLGVLMLTPRRALWEKVVRAGTGA